jgi:hypothetical protein
VAHDVGERAGCLRVVVDPAVPTGVEDEPCERALPERMSSPDRDVAAAPVPPADDRDGLVGLVAAERSGVCRNQLADLGDDCFEDIVRRRALRDEGGDTPKRRLLLCKLLDPVAIPHVRLRHGDHRASIRADRGADASVALTVPHSIRLSGTASPRGRPLA